MWNRTFDHAAHVRIDHGTAWLEYSIFLFNSRLPGMQLFQCPDVAAALQRNYNIPAMPHPRTLTRAQYDESLLSCCCTHT